MLSDRGIYKWSIIVAHPPANELHLLARAVTEYGAVLAFRARMAYGRTAGALLLSRSSPGAELCASIANETAF
ncbi:MAG: hypothetical protein BGP09_21615 [Rhizobium sp. 60-20]|nr:MAG: hypothetical protein BGP09_21615 [Rhizobium sp. 60-20]